AHAARVTGDVRYGDFAARTWRVMKARFRDDLGGFRRRAGRDWRDPQGNSQNPMMHLFEALLTLHDATGDETVLADAKELAEFIFTKLYRADGGYLPESYRPDWTPLGANEGGYVDLGHQFEWAYLLSWAVEKGFDKRYLDIATKLLDFGMTYGFDGEAGGIFGASAYDGTVRGRSKGWWQQAEHLRALMRHAGRHGRDDLWPAFDASLAFVKAHLMDAEHGGWYGSYDPAKPRGAAQMGKGTVWKTGYHTAGMYVEALKLTGKHP
ncbi:hypothetical protein LCGC14_2530330, partial [marine sediment metagenome]